MKPNPIRARDQLNGWLLIAPALLLLLLVFAYPIGRAFWLSLFAQNLGTQLQPVFSGFDNYVRMAFDGRFWQSLGNTAYFTLLSVVLELGLGLGIALVLNQSLFLVENLGMHNLISVRVRGQPHPAT